jgi:alpha-tubulin suppressor-like RCC1 family protein
VRAISTGDGPNLVLKEDGSIEAFGFIYDKHGNMPPGLKNVTGILAVGYTDYILINNESVYGWGSTQSFGPCPVQWIPDPNLTLFSSCNSPFVLQKNGNLYRLTGNTTDPKYLHLLDNVTEVSSRGIRTLALKNDGTVTGWENYPDQTPRIVDVPQNLSNVIAISPGWPDLALRQDGTIVAWGTDNKKGELDVPSNLTKVTAIASGYYYSLALKSDGTVVCWGNNFAGNCEVPEGLHDVVAISAGQYNTLALKKDGTIVSWGGLVIPDWIE